MIPTRAWVLAIGSADAILFASLNLLAFGAITVATARGLRAETSS